MEIRPWGCHRRDPSILPEREDDAPGRGRSIQLRLWRMFKSWIVQEGKERHSKQMGKMPSRLTEELKTWKGGLCRHVTEGLQCQAKWASVFYSTGHFSGSNILSKGFWSLSIVKSVIVKINTEKYLQDQEASFSVLWLCGLLSSKGQEEWLFRGCWDPHAHSRQLTWASQGPWKRNNLASLKLSPISPALGASEGEVRGKKLSYMRWIIEEVTAMWAKVSILFLPSNSPCNIGEK